jgi:hypothetical protein
VQADEDERQPRLDDAEAAWSPVPELGRNHTDVGLDGSGDVWMLSQGNDLHLLKRVFDPIRCIENIGKAPVQQGQHRTGDVGREPVTVNHRRGQGQDARRMDRAPPAIDDDIRLPLGQVEELKQALVAMGLDLVIVQPTARLDRFAMDPVSTEIVVELSIESIGRDRCHGKSGRV